MLLLVCIHQESVYKGLDSRIQRTYIMNIINHNLVYSIYQRLHRLYLHDHDRLTFRRTEFQSDLLEKWMMDTRYVDKQLSETDKKTTPVETTGVVLLHPWRQQVSFCYKSTNRQNVDVSKNLERHLEFVFLRNNIKQS